MRPFVQSATPPVEIKIETNNNQLQTTRTETEIDIKIQKEIHEEVIRGDSYTKTSNILINFQNIFKSKAADIISNILRIVWDDQGTFMLIPFMIWFFQGPNGLVVLFVVVSNELLNGILKWIIQKPRPFWVIKKLANLSSKWETSYSFPSGHSQFSSAYICTILILFGQYIPWYCRTILITIPLLAGLSRIYLGVHGIECVICGWIIGVLFSCLMCFLFPYLFEWFANIDTISSIIFTVFACVICPYLLLQIIIKLFKPPDKNILQIWTEIAKNNTYVTADVDEKSIANLKLKPRQMEKYTFHIWSFFGGTLGLIIQLSGVKVIPGFIDNLCNVSEHIVDLIFIVIIGYSVTIIILFPIVFILPPKLKKLNKQKLAICSTIFGSFFCGIWLTFLCPFIAYSIFGLSC